MDLHVQRARLRPTPAGDPKRKAIHDFSNSLQELVWAVNLGETAAVQRYLDHIRDEYRRALEK